MKRILYVRHGQTDGNAGPIQRSSDAQLTDEGKMQARILGEYFSKQGEEFDLVVSSSFQRAIDTAVLVSGLTEDEVQTHDSFVERRRASVLIGKSKTDPECVKIRNQIHQHFGTDYKHSDEENFDDLNARAGECVKLFNAADFTNMLCIGHGFFGRIVAAKLMFGDQLDGATCKVFSEKLKLDNTGVCEFVKYTEDGWWRLNGWNNMSHLG